MDNKARRSFNSYYQGLYHYTPRFDIISLFRIYKGDIIFSGQFRECFEEVVEICLYSTEASKVPRAHRRFDFNHTVCVLQLISSLHNEILQTSSNSPRPNTLSGAPFSNVGLDFKTFWFG